MSQAPVSERNLIEQLAASFEAREFYSPPSQQLGPFDLARGYELQRAYVAHWQTRDQISGFKAAVTAAPMQRAFGLPGPVTSVLFHKGLRRNRTSISKGDFRTLLIETELAFRLSDSISAPLTTVEQLRELTARCSPAFELADPGFGATKFTGEDLVATNIACGGWIEGPALDWHNTDLDAIVVRLERDGELLHEAPAGSVMEGQWTALLWLINQTVNQGYTITPEHLLLTGAIGAAHPGQSGHYEADYGDAGCIAFQLTDQQPV